MTRLLCTSLVFSLLVSLAGQNVSDAQDAGTRPEAPARGSGGLFGWLCDVLGVSCEADVSEVREGLPIEPRHGRRVLRTRPRARVETEIHTCGDCWAPTPMADGGVLLATPEGLLRIPPIGRAELILRTPEGRRIATIIGHLRDDSSSFLVVTSATTDGGAASFSILVADIRRRSFLAAPDGLSQPLNGIDVERARSRANRVRHGVVLRTSPQSGHGPLTLQQSSTRGATAPRAGLLSATRRSFEALTPALTRRDDGVNRFDPVWVGMSTDVIYMAEP